MVYLKLFDKHIKLFFLQQTFLFGISNSPTTWLILQYSIVVNFHFVCLRYCLSFLQDEKLMKIKRKHLIIMLYFEKFPLFSKIIYRFRPFQCKRTLLFYKTHILKSKLFNTTIRMYTGWRVEK